ncbi:SdiA-regulated domain-containing protein [Candidatus Woesearchaeota archaeon]|nr:SdiA-regulated domain-containing protein [Candidatus Woesearchaeota archaeon]
MKTKTTCISIFVLLLLFAQTVFAASWPTQSTGTVISSGLPSTYEPSGAVWHPRLNALFVVSDDDMITRMDIDGTDVTSWTLSGDLEGLAIADPSSNYIYVLNEYPYAIYEFDFTTGTKTKSWSLTGIVPAPVISTSYGLEGLTYISSEGLFAVGSQETGIIYFLSLDTSVNGGTVSVVRSMKPYSASISDMYFDPETETLYVLYDATLVEMDTSGNIIATYTVPGSDQEAVTLATSCPSTTSTIIIGSDTGHTFTSYAGYPVTCPSSGSGGSGSTTAVWPASSSGTNVGSGLSSSFEPSGVVWNSASNKLVVVNDNGGVSIMNSDGSSVTSLTLSGDLEGVSVSGAFAAYILNEYPFAIYAFNTGTGTKTATFDLSSIGITTPSTTSNGLEGMAYIPDGAHSYGTTALGGIFAVGSSDDGRIYFVSIPTSSGTATLLGSIQPVAEAITDMFYSSETELLYVLYGTTLREMTVDGTVVMTYTSVPGTDPEGFTLVTDCATSTADAYIANDEGNTVMKYTGYPITCSVEPTPVDLDADDDGLLDTEEATYGTNPNLVDTDGDGLTDYQEVITYGTSGTTADTDGDGLSDYQEIITYGTDARDTDSDNDSLTDYQEVVTYGTNPLNADSDSGSVDDATEIARGTNPLDSTDDVPVVIDPNQISSYTIDTANALVTVYYADGHTGTINPFTGTDSILVGLNYDNTVLVVTNGKRMKTYQNGVAKDNEYISKYTPSAMTLTITHGSSSDTVALQYTVRRKTSTMWFTLTGTNLVRN